LTSYDLVKASEFLGAAPGETSIDGLTRFARVRADLVSTETRFFKLSL
jgi:hypothetical protein